MSFIIDAHEDIAYNVLTYGRNYLRSAGETRQLEFGTPVPERAGQSLLGWPEYQKGQVALVFATLFVAPARYKGGSWENLFFVDYGMAHRLLSEQVEIYQRLTGDHPDKFRLVQRRKDLSEVLSPWQQAPANPPHVTHPVGLVLLLEGAEGISAPQELEEWWQAGVRIVGPVWAGTRFCGGSREPGGFTHEGLVLLEVMAGLGMSLDIAHMSEESALTALDRFEGSIIASHANAAALLKGNAVHRHLSDLVLRRLIERDGIVGVMPFNKFLNPEWSPDEPRERVPLSMLVAHIDHICQMAGNARHVALGTDFDGGFGWPSVPYEINTIADLQKLKPLLVEKGYSEEDIAAILGTNWQQYLERTLPE